MDHYGYQVTRQLRNRYSDRDKYFANYAKRAPKNPQLCQVMAAVVGDPRSPGRPSAYDPVDDPAAMWKGFPWLTLVLGSGCLELPDDPNLTPMSLARGVARVLAQDPHPPDDGASDGGDPLSERAGRFTAELVRDRTHPPFDALATDDPSRVSNVRPVAARLTLVATQLTSLYFLAKGAVDSPVSRWDGGEATVAAAEGVLRTGRTVEVLMRSSLEQIAVTRRLLADPGIPPDVAKAIDLLLEDVVEDLTPPETRRLLHLHLRLVTESAWYLLTHNTSIYPGWTDLLLGLMLRENRSRTDPFTRTRPQFWDLQTIPEMVGRLHQRATELSWEALSAASEEPGPWGPAGDTAPAVPAPTRGRLYQQAANVLWAQARLLRKTRHTNCPPASAFVTSFDIELEMALWLSGNRLDDHYWTRAPAAPGDGPGGGRPSFYVVVPVHVFRFPGDTEAALCWFRGEVHPDPSFSPGHAFSQIVRPGTWHLLTPNRGATQLLEGPHVVHLSGCPLFTLPDARGPHGSVAEREEAVETVERIVSDLAAVGVNVDAEKVHFQHAVTVDEYLAFRQSEAEQFWSASQGTDSPSRGLHSFLFGSSKSSTDLGQNPRFWMALGVPVSDATIRHRMVSQITLRNTLSMAKPAVEAVRPSGAGAGASPAGRLGSRPTGPPPPSSAAADDHAADDGDATDSSGPRSGVGQSRELNGVVVNKRINDDEASILYWLGLDVVSTDVRQFIDDLRHYASHLSTTTPGGFSPTLGCDVPRTADASRT